MKIPLRPTNYKLSKSIPGNIIIHSTSCQLPNISDLMLDNSKYQTYNYHIDNWNKRQDESKFHYIVDLVNDDYQVVTSQPLLTLSSFDDLYEEFESSVHIAVMGDYDLDIPENRLYEIMAYRTIVPLMRLFRIQLEDVYTHKEISSNFDNCFCPGHNFDIGRLKQYIRKYLRQYSVNILRNSF